MSARPLLALGLLALLFLAGCADSLNVVRLQLEGNILTTVLNTVKNIVAMLSIVASLSIMQKAIVSYSIEQNPNSIARIINSLIVIFVAVIAIFLFDAKMIKDALSLAVSQSP